ncbi:MAG: hypothetical protein GXY76_17735 [Chloroflexi bacterium]|nr:hypothetical protein [Chloroflexota bacterium]
MEELERLYAAAVDHHRQKHLREAYFAYWDVLRRDPPAPLSEDQRTAVRRHLPRLYITPAEPLPLKAAAVIVHPARHEIAYHLFWEDDIDFADDQEPCDHEVIWVAHDGAGRVVRVQAYYHGFIASSAPAVEEANAQGGRPRYEVQWGKHGSLPWGWQGLYDGRILADMEATHRRLHEQGRRDQDNPLTREWPRRFGGSWADFVDFRAPVDLGTWVEREGAAWASRWGNGVIATHVLRYNFCPKHDWPEFAQRGTAGS